MPTMKSSLNTALQSALYTGNEALSNYEQVVFVKYVRVVLPLDGFVFWVRSDLVSSLEVPQSSLPARIPVSGSFHYTSSNEQEEDYSNTVNNVTFTSEQKVDEFNQVNSDEMYIGTFEGLDFAFSQMGSFYNESNLYHYTGTAILPSSAPFIVKSLSQINLDDLFISNSMPIWLAMNKPSIFFPSFSPFPIFPSYLVPLNYPPPYASIDIDETEALQPVPYHDQCWNHYQLVKERVRITTYGLNNSKALQFLDFILNQSLNQGTFGIMNAPTVKDEKKKQREINIIALKKRIDLEISYNQFSLVNIARQLILSCMVNVNIGFPGTLVIRGKLLTFARTAVLVGRVS